VKKACPEKTKLYWSRIFRTGSVFIKVVLCKCCCKTYFSHNK